MVKLGPNWESDLSPRGTEGRSSYLKLLAGGPVGVAPTTSGLKGRCEFGPESRAIPDSERAPFWAVRAPSLLVTSRRGMTRGFYVTIRHDAMPWSIRGNTYRRTVAAVVTAWLNRPVRRASSDPSTICVMRASGKTITILFGTRLGLPSFSSAPVMSKASGCPWTKRLTRRC